jgi:ABC-type transport system substrate-binding protein
VRRSAALSIRSLVACIGLLACREPGDGPRLFGAGATGPRRGGVLRISLNDGVRTLDPTIAYDELSNLAGHMLFDTLLGYEPATRDGAGMQLVPQLAERWSVSDDGLRYSFELRPGLVFSDGRPCVAGDFVYALERVLTEPTSPFQQFLMGIAGAAELSAGAATSLAGARALDDRRLEIALREPDASFAYILAMPFATPQKREHVEPQAPDERRRAPLGTGPFVLVQWREGDRLVFARNPRYWDAAVPYLDGLIIHEAVERDTAFLKFLAGELDAIDRLSSADFIFVAQHAGWAPYLYNVPSMNVYGEKLNCSRPPFDDRRVRQAMNYALDKQHVIKLQNGRAVPSHGALPPLMPGYEPALQPYPHDPARARELLAEAGYPDGFRVTYATQHDELSEKLAQSLKADLAEVGVDVQIELMSFPAYLTAAGKPDLAFAFTSWLMDYPDPSNFLDVKFHSRMIAPENSNNDAFYSNPEVDRRLDAARREVDPERRWAMYRELEALLYEEAPWIWSYHRNVVELRQPYVMDYHPHPVWNRDYRTTWLDLAADGAPVPR